MRLPRIRFTIRWMMGAVIVVAAFFGLPALASQYNWWEVKPFLNLALFPILVVILSRSPPRRVEVSTAIFLDVFFLALWATARRPYTGTTLKGLWFDDPIVELRAWASGGLDFAQAFKQVVWTYSNSEGGLLADLACLVCPLLILAYLLVKPVWYPSRLAISIILILGRISDWLIWPRMRTDKSFMPEPSMSFGTLKEADAPISILSAWLRGDYSIGKTLGLLEAGRVLELVVLLSLFALTSKRLANKFLCHDVKRT